MNKLWFPLFVILFILSCKEDRPQVGVLENINIRMKNDPQRIHSIFAPTADGREVFQYIYMPLADFHPETLELSPILIEKVPEGRLVSGEDGDSLLAFDLKFKADAKWSDGTDLSSSDYIFTVKAVKHNLSKANAWRTYFDFIKDVIPDPDDENKLTVLLDPEYMLAKELCVTLNLLPRHIYDKDGLLADVSIPEINNKEQLPLDSTLLQYFEGFNNSMNDKKDVVQLGPYQLTDYQTDQYIVLSKVPNYWGDNYPDNPFLQGFAQQLIFNIVPDELTAVTMAKEGKLDVLPMHSTEAFLAFRDDSLYSKTWSFHTPQLTVYYFIGFNNKKGLLQDVNIRKAVALCTDVDDIIQNLDGGLGVRTTGHFHPTKSYYNEKLKPVPYDIEKAKTYLKASGWEDLDGDNMLDKIIGGKKVPLELEIIITGSQLSKTIALLMQESAAKAGIKIIITTKPITLTRKENLSVFDYDMVAGAVSQDAAPDDPYLRWHSDNAVEGGGNSTGYQNSVSDSLINVIRKTRDVKSRDLAYRALQEVMYEDQPVLFLYSPLMKIAINNRLNAMTTPKRPGYMANTFSLIEAQ